MTPQEKFQTLYNVWSGMKQRCYNQRNKDYPSYGGRGITVDKKWKDSFENFFIDMVGTYKQGLTIERMDNNKGYSKKNCKWTMRSEQPKNRRPFKEWNSKYNDKSFKEARNKRLKKEFAHLLEVRAFYMDMLNKKGTPKQDIAFIFNVHSSQVTRALKNT